MKHVSKLVPLGRGAAAWWNAGGTEVLCVAGGEMVWVCFTMLWIIQLICRSDQRMIHASRYPLLASREHVVVSKCHLRKWHCNSHEVMCCAADQKSRLG